MHPTPESFNEIARAIQLALAPVFLLTGIAGLLNVMASRLARVIDRSRVLAEGKSSVATPGQGSVDLEQRALTRRRQFISIAITACTIAALLICVVIAALFAEVMLGAPMTWLIVGLFTGAMLSLVIGLTCFLREVHLAMKAIPRSGAHPGH